MNDSNRDTGRHRRSLMTIAQWASIGLGVILLGWYVVARGHGSVASKAAIEDFRDGQKPGIAVEALVSDLSGFSTSEPVDTSLWSDGRVEAYNQTLLKEEKNAVGVLSMPRLDLEVPVFEGTDDWVLNRGAGLIEGTASPGEVGNVGIAAHRDSFFRVLQDVAVGDTLILESPVGSATYHVESFHIVEPTDVGVLSPTNEPTITLVTCYPFYFVGSAPQRFIVRATGVQIGFVDGSTGR